MEKQELKEIKRGHTGTGLLIENDGYISTPASRINEAHGDGQWHCPNPFIVDAVFQKFGIKNANGRIYPESILRREVENYMEKVREHRAIGECYTPDVLCLTDEGWKELKDVKEGDNVLSLNVETQEIEVKKVIRKIEREYSGDMIRIKGRHINDLVTPEHKFPLFDRNGKFFQNVSAKEIFENEANSYSHNAIRKIGIWNKADDEYITIEGIGTDNKRTLRDYPSCNEPLILKTASFAKFMGIYLSEGDFKKNSGLIHITQKKEEGCALIEEMLNELGLPYKIYGKENCKKTFTIKDIRLNKYVEKFGNCYTKYVPNEIKNLSKENLRLFYDWFVLGDGRVRGDKRRKKGASLTDDVFSTSKRLALDLNEIQLKIGYNGTFHSEERNTDRLIEGRLIKGENCHPMHFTLRSLSQNVWLDKRFISVEAEQYNGTVMCIEVEGNHNWFVMSNGFTHWTGNCNHPETSTIDLSRVSHNIIELHWEGQTLVGKMELNLTPGFIKHGIASSQGDVVANLLLNGYKIGVSSRGVGSVESRMGQMIVGDDFELICWDIVSDPSTPLAWISTSGPESMQTWIEADSTKNQKPKINEKIEKINKILTK